MTRTNSDQHGPSVLARGAMEAEALNLLTSDLVESSPDRVKFVAHQIRTTGTYQQMADELLAGARMAWRNHSRCVGRAIWHTLELRDARHIDTADAVAAECIAHLRQSTNGGKLRPMITVFADPTNGPNIQILNRQLIGYAGYRRAGDCIGDPANVDLTDRAVALGWSPSGGRFDVLPLMISIDGVVSWYDIPEDAVLRVAISHPDYPELEQLGLTWHANPAVSNMVLAAGGLRYPAAPFSGWYVATEIGARDLTDDDRYNQLEVVAEAIGLHRGRNNLWKDRVMVILTEAVLHSYAVAGVTVTDHHRVGRQFVNFVRREEKCGRDVPTDWSWVNPPMSASAVPTFHRLFDDPQPVPVPNFLRCG
jgi:nitric-oxide synthase, bacterial